MLRHNKGYQPLPPKEKKRKATDDVDEERQAAREAAMIPRSNTLGVSVPQSVEYAPQAEPASLPPLAPEEAARRAQRAQELEASSEQLLQTRKRRRRIRGWGHMGPDPAGLEPRYRSETSLDECKAFLHLSNDLYNQIRNEFEAICRADGVMKMSECADGQWQNVKDKLIRQNTYLSSVLHPLQGDIEKKSIAVNCICMDVTKRMRTMSKQISTADANNILELDPLQSKEIRRQLYGILRADHFTTVVACGNDHLEELRQQWYAQSEFLTRVIAEGDPEKLKALKLLDRDTRKRFGEDRKKDPESTAYAKPKNYGPGPGPATGPVRMKRGPLRTYNECQGESPQPSPSNNTNNTNNNTPSVSRPTENFSAASRRTIAAVGPAWIGHQVPRFQSTTIADMMPPINFDIDPALDQLGRPSHGPFWPPMASFDSDDRGADPLSLSNGQPVHATRPAHNEARPASSSTASIPAYFRLSNTSSLIGHHPRMWLGKLSSQSVHALHTAATAKAGAATVRRVQGIVKNADGGEDSYLIENEDELEVYLGEAGEKATFVVELVGGYA